MTRTDATPTTWVVQFPTRTWRVRVTPRATGAFGASPLRPDTRLVTRIGGSPIEAIVALLRYLNGPSLRVADIVSVQREDAAPEVSS